MRKALIFIGILVGAFTLPGCRKGATHRTSGESGSELAQAQASASAAIAAAMQALAAASTPRGRAVNDTPMALLAMPEMYLTMTDVRPDPKGLPSHSLRLASLTLSNNSHFGVANLQGTVTWLDAKGESLGSAPFSLSGTVLAGEKKLFSTAVGTLASTTVVHGAATASTVSIDHLQVMR